MAEVLQKMEVTGSSGQVALPNRGMEPQSKNPTEGQTLPAHCLQCELGLPGTLRMACIMLWPPLRPVPWISDTIPALGHSL